MLVHQELNLTNSKVQINLNNIPKGVYYVKIMMVNAVVTKKLIVSN